MNKTIEKEDLRIVFYGTPSFAVPTLEKLIVEKFNVVLVVTSPGETPVKNVADRCLLPTYETENPTRNTDELVRVLDRYKPNLGIVIAFKILPPDIFMYPELGTFNIHASYLPDYRGAAPINWAIINGENELGLTAFWLDEGIDTGRIIKQRRFNISLNPNLDSYFTFGQAYQTLSENYSPYFCMEVIQMIMDGVKGIVQKVKGDEPKAPKLTRMNTWIDWGECATDVTNFIRGLSPKPGALSLVFGQECKILEGRPETRMLSSMIYEPGTERIIGRDLYIMTGDYWLRVDLIWKAGGKGPISGKDFVNGMKSQGKK